MSLPPLAPQLEKPAPPTTEASAAANVSPEPAGAKKPPARFRGPDQTTHWTLLIGSTVMLLLAIGMSTQGDQKVAMPFMKAPLPGLCASRTYLGLDCPGCGLTRCFISLAHGDIARAWHFNPAGLWFFVLVVAQIPWRTVQLWRIHHGQEPYRLRWLNWTLWILLVLLIGQWLLKMTLNPF